MAPYPDKKTFLALSKRFNLVPVYREILADLETPVSLFLKVAGGPYSYLLESVEGGEHVARYSFIAGKPRLVFQSSGRAIKIVENGKTHAFQTAKDPLFELEKILKRFRQAQIQGLPPFSGGAVGYLGYDAVRFFEKIPDKNPDRFGIPDSVFVFTDTLFVFDHLSRKIMVIANVAVDSHESAEEAYESAVQKIDSQINRIRATPAAFSFAASRDRSKPAFQSNFTKGAFEKIVQKAKTYIKKGDIIQVVLSQAFRTPVRTGAFDIYRALRTINPSPYMFYLNSGEFSLVGSSPEVHVRCERGKAELRPIAGTRRRGKDPAEDARLEKELLNDAKERAEHLMLVDLGRNDLGRVCEYKSVNVRDFMTIERYSHVMHIVSHVEGTLRKDKTIFDVLRATFPAGTVTGAPKVRAMEIIDELENQRRGFYSGVAGYFGYSGNLDSCITIRTLLVKDSVACVQAGAGVVADSVPSREYQETVNKAKALLKAVEMAESGVLA